MDSDPKPFSVQQSTPDEISVFFSEPLELTYSSIDVLDPNGEKISIDSAFNVDDDPSTIATKLQDDIGEGTFTVSTKVLSAVDGHLVSNSFIFSIDAEATTGQIIDTLHIDKFSRNDDIFAIEEAISRGPSFIGQIIIIGSIISFIWLLRPFSNQIKSHSFSNLILQYRRDDLDKNLLKLILVGITLVLVSTIAMIIVQSLSINAGLLEAVSTSFGTIWAVRMFFILVLFSFAVYLYYRLYFRNKHNKKSIIHKKNLYTMLGLGLIILFTYSLISHSAATPNKLSILLDLSHGIAASIWVGGLIFIGFVFMKSLLKNRSNPLNSIILSVIIPRYSVIIVTILGIVILTGPLLLYVLEDNIQLTAHSYYGKLLMIKLLIGTSMILLGFYHQRITQKNVMNDSILLIKNNRSSLVNQKNKKSSGNSNSENFENHSLTPIKYQKFSKFSRLIKLESILGIFLLFIVSLMANMSLPSGEFPYYKQETQQSITSSILSDIATEKNQINYLQENQNIDEFLKVIHIDNGKVEISITPFNIGENQIELRFLDQNDQPMTIVDNASLKITQLEKGIGPIEIETTTSNEDGVFIANLPISLAGLWGFEIYGDISEKGIADIAISFNLKLNPKLMDLKFNLTEYKTVDASLLLYPTFDSKRNSMWIGDTSPGSSQLWQFNLETNEFIPHNLEDFNLITFSAFDKINSDILWITDPTKSTIGKYNLETQEIQIFKTPENGIISGLTIDSKNNLWLSDTINNKIYNFITLNNSFTSYDIPTKQSNPLALVYDDYRNVVWFVESIGKLGKLDLTSKNIIEFTDNNNENSSVSDSTKVLSDYLNEPTFLTIDPNTQNIIISNHGDNSITVFNPLFLSFDKYELGGDGLAFGMVFDDYDKLWIAQHVTDSVVVLDLLTGDTQNVNITTSGSFVQHLTKDSKGNIWFAEQRGNGLGSIKTIVQPSFSTANQQEPQQESSTRTVNQSLPSENITGLNLPTINEIRDYSLDAFNKLKFEYLFGPVIAIGIILSAIFYTINSRSLIYLSKYIK